MGSQNLQGKTFANQPFMMRRRFLGVMNAAGYFG